MTAHAPGALRRVLLAHPSADLYGSDRVALESVSALVDAGWQVLVTLPGDGPMVPALRERGALVEVCPTLVLRKALLRPSGLGQLVQQTVGGLRHGGALLRRARPDAVYVNTVTIPLWPLLARLRRVPVLCHVHEAEGSASALVRGALAAPLLLGDVVVANSRFSISVLASSFRRLGMRTRLVYNGVPGPTVEVAPRAELDPPVRVVYVGRLSPRKGVDVAVEAVGMLAARGVAAELDLVGAVFPGYEWYQEELEQKIESAGLTGAVHLHGFQDSVWSLVQAADVVVVPSRVDEPFGNTAVEAVLAARPVIASATSGLLEATDGYASAQTVAPGDAASLADAIERVTSDWPRWSADATRDAGRAAERHGPDVYRTQIAAILEEMVTR